MMSKFDPPPICCHGYRVGGGTVGGSGYSDMAIINSD